MRQDQYEKLQGLQEKLIDVALTECDPDKWPGVNIDPGAMDAKTRGDRYWSKKNAVATIALTLRIEALIGRVQGVGASLNPTAEQEADEESSIDHEVKQAERDASRLLDEMQRRAQKTAFDKSVHGKAG